MRPWASWTAKTAVFSLAAGLAATAVGSAAWAAFGSGAGVALAATGSAASAARGGVASAARGGVAALDARGGSPALAARGGAIGSGQVTAQTALAGDVCRDAGALLGIVGAACQSVTLVASPGPALGPAPAPLTAVTGTPSSRDSGADGASAPGTDRTSATPPAARAGNTNVPAATQLAGLGALPGLADLPSAGPASTPARNGAPGGGIPMPGTALSAASSGVSSDSFAALAVGALLAGASALKIAGRRTRDRKAGIGVVAQ
jgi:hypothetical protein